MRRFIVAWVCLVAGFLLLAPSRARAGTPYNIHWVMGEDADSCEDAKLSRASYFDVNKAPIPTFMVPGAYSVHEDGSKSNVADAPFDSVLLRWGANDIHFQVTITSGDNSCVRASEIVTLVSEPLGIQKPLFNVRREGTAFSGSTNVALELEEINPPLAKAIANLEAEIKAEREWLISHAAEAASVAERLDALKALDTELHDLVTRPLDAIAQEDLDAIFDRYKDVISDSTRAALEQLLDDLKQSVVDLEKELASLIDNFGAAADAAADFATADARAAGFDPDDPSGYSLTHADAPWIEVPDVSGVQGAFEAGNDPYGAYADAVLATLGDFVQGGKVVAKGSFAANVRAWRANQGALEAALLARMSVSQAETSAFLNAQNKVTNFIQQFMDASYWYLDTSVPPDVRAVVDGVLKVKFAELADELKDALNVCEDCIVVDLEHTQLFETIRAFAGAMETVGEISAPYIETMATVVHATTRIGVGFVPYVGPALDLCEAVTGRAFCISTGKELGISERVLSGIGFGIGAIAKPWSGVKNAAINPAGKAAAEEILMFGEEIGLALQASRKLQHMGLRGAAVPLANEFEKKAALYLMKNEGRMMLGFGDDGVRKVLGIPSASGPYNSLGAAPDFLSLTKGNSLALSEAKGLKDLVNGEVDISKALEQLENAVKKIKERNLLGELTRAEVILPKGAALKDTNLKVANGFLVRLNKGNVPYTFDGFEKLFVRVIEL